MRLEWDICQTTSTESPQYRPRLVWNHQALALLDLNDAFSFRDLLPATIESPLPYQKFRINSINEEDKAMIMRKQAPRKQESEEDSC